MTTQAEYFQEHAVNGELTDAQTLKMLHLPEGDTSATLESGKPDAAASEEATNDEVQGKQDEKNEPEATQAEPDPTKAVVLAKDGVHTIPYEKLTEARGDAKQWKEQAEAALAELEAFKAQAQKRADAGEAPTRTDAQAQTAEAAIEAGIDPEIFGDFSEEALAKGVATLVDMRADAISKAVEKRLAEVLAPILEQQKTTAATSHYSTIYERHPDADSIAESKELADWIASQPKFLQASYQAVLSQGSTADVIEFFDTFKAATGKTPQPTTEGKPDVAAAAKAALAKAKAQVPTSLSEIPAGSKAPHDEAQALMEMSDSNTLASFMSKTPEQIRALLERSL